MRRIDNPWDLGRVGEDFFWHFGQLHDNIEMVRRYTTKEEQRVNGDFQASVDGVMKNIDAKVELVRSPNFVVELVQDTETGDTGWFYALTNCQEIWAAQANLDELAPFGLAFWSIFRVSFPRLRTLFESHGEQWHPYDAARGYGATTGKKVPYRTLVDQGAAKLWWGWKYDGPFKRLSPAEWQ